jgi:hypothetical protein
MQLSKVLVSTAAAAALLTVAAGQASAARHHHYRHVYHVSAVATAPKGPVRNPSGGVIGQPPNHPTGQISGWGPVGSTKAVRNPSGGVIGQPPNHPTGQISGWGPVGSTRAVRNPSGGVIGQPPNHPTAGTVAYVGNIGVGGAPNNFPKSPARHRDTSHGDER